MSRHVSLYAPDLLYLSRVWGFDISSFWSVLLVRRAILMSAFLKMFVTKVVSLPTYVKRAHLCAVLPGFWLGVTVVFDYIQFYKWGLRCSGMSRSPPKQNAWHLTTGQTGCPETSLTSNYRCVTSTQKCTDHLHRSGNLVITQGTCICKYNNTSMKTFNFLLIGPSWSLKPRKKRQG